MFRQTETKYKYVMLGFGTSSIYYYGCYLVSFCNGLNQKGYSFTPESLNDMLKAHNAYVGPYRNYIDVANLQKYFPQIFVSFQQIDLWNDVPPTTDLLKSNLVVVCRVSAKPIGGTGDHFVLLTGIQDGVAIINDPWTGATEKITKRWGSLGNILGIRIFKIIPFVQPVIIESTTTSTSTSTSTVTTTIEVPTTTTETTTTTLQIPSEPVIPPDTEPVTPPSQPGQPINEKVTIYTIIANIINWFASIFKKK